MIEKNKSRTRHNNKKKSLNNVRMFLMERGLSQWEVRKVLPVMRRDPELVTDIAVLAARMQVDWCFYRRHMSRWRHNAQRNATLTAVIMVALLLTSLVVWAAGRLLFQVYSGCRLLTAVSYGGQENERMVVPANGGVTLIPYLAAVVQQICVGWLFCGGDVLWGRCFIYDGTD